ncbi:MAG TPA: Smr/MutS family protein [Mesorhizobium sp.]|nr:Smr/MutS family protein [Mesorhizobium sp.]
MSRRTKLLSDEDRVLWRTVAETVEPLREPKPPKAKPPAVAPSAPAPAPLPPAESAPPQAAAPAAPAPPRPRPPPSPAGLDRPTHEKLAKGRVPIEGRVDLHGLFQDEAHALLLSFLRQARARGVRHVLVITGKGVSSGGDGVLRRMVPAWLGTALFRELVSGFDEAARGHGGGGALYIRLKHRKA